MNKRFSDSASAWSSSGSRSSRPVATPTSRPRRARTALQAFSAAQNVKLTYNDQGQLVDHGTTEGAAAIMSLLTNDWGYKVDATELNPNDPLVNTASEYMYQMATITVPHPPCHHDRHLPRRMSSSTARSSRPPAPTTSRTPASTGPASTGPNPIEGAARDKIWTGTALALIGRARRRQRHRLGPPDGPRHRRPLRPRRPHGRPDRPRPGLGDPGRDREGQGSGLPAGRPTPPNTVARVTRPRHTERRASPRALAVSARPRLDAVASAR